jgi:pimeloyl-ACP methyl ester carboxylesterase
MELIEMDLYFKETGNKESETIIFLHELNMASWMWYIQMESLPDYHCIVPDLPGHGESQDVVKFTAEDAAKQVIELIDQRSVNGKAHLVGVALGAQIILQILSRAPEVADKVLISGALINSTPTSESFHELLDYLLDVYIPVKDDHLSIGSYIRCYGIPKNQMGKYKMSTRVIKPETAFDIHKENILFEMPDNLDKFPNSVLVMAGEKDYSVIKRCTPEIADILPCSKAYLAPGVGHIWNLEAPELFNQVLRSFLSGKPLPDVLIKLG